MSAEQRRPTTLEAIVAAIRHESSDRQRMAVLILLFILIGTLGLSVGYLIGVKDIDAAALEAAGTWFGALVSLGAVVIAARVFLSDKLYQHYQVTADEQERAEQAEKDRALVNEARRIKFETGELPPDGIQTNGWIELRVVNNSYHTMSEVRVTHSTFPVDTREAVFQNDEIHPGGRQGYGIQCLEPVQTHTLEKLIFAEVTMTFTLNGRKWIKRGVGDPELAE